MIRATSSRVVPRLGFLPTGASRQGRRGDCAQAVRAGGLLTSRTLNDKAIYSKEIKCRHVIPQGHSDKGINESRSNKSRIAARPPDSNKLRPRPCPIWN